MEADISTQAVGLASSADFSLINLFIRADIIVKSVIILLILCSIYSWAVIIEKIRLFKKINESSEEFEKKIDDSLLISYKKIRSSVKNGLAIVPVERGASAGSFFVIPPQVQLDIASRKKFITDEYSGRILVDKDLAEDEEKKMEKIFNSI